MIRYTKNVEGAIYEEHVQESETERIQSLQENGWVADGTQTGAPSPLGNIQHTTGAERFAPESNTPNTVPESFDPRRLRTDTRREPTEWELANAKRAENAESFLTGTDARSGAFTLRGVQSIDARRNAAPSGNVTVQFVLHGVFCEASFGSMKDALEWLGGLMGGTDAPTQVFVGQAGAAG